MTFVATHYKGRPAVFDTVARVYYVGFSSMRKARRRAEALTLHCAKG